MKTFVGRLALGMDDICHSAVWAGTIYVVATKGDQGSSILVREPRPSDAIDSGDDEMVPVGFRDITTTMDVYAKDGVRSMPCILCGWMLQAYGPCTFRFSLFCIQERPLSSIPRVSGSPGDLIDVPNPHEEFRCSTSEGLDESFESFHESQNHPPIPRLAWPAHDGDLGHSLK